MKTTPMHERWQEGRGLKVVNKTQELVLPKQTLDRIGGDGPKKALGSFFGCHWLTPYPLYCAQRNKRGYHTEIID